MKYTEAQIVAAVKNMVNAWDREALVDAVIDDRLDQYLGLDVNPEEIELLMDDHSR